MNPSGLSWSKDFTFLCWSSTHDMHSIVSFLSEREKVALLPLFPYTWLLPNVIPSLGFDITVMEAMKVRTIDMACYMAGHDLPLPLHHLACLQGAEQEFSQGLKFEWGPLPLVESSLPHPHIHLPKNLVWIETQTSSEPEGSLSSQVDGYCPSSKPPPVPEESFMLMGHPSSLLPLKRFLQSLAMAQLDLGSPLWSFPSPSDLWVLVIVRRFCKLYLSLRSSPAGGILKLYPNKPSAHTTSTTNFSNPIKC